MGHAPLDPDLAPALLELSCTVEQIRASVSRALGLTPQQAQLLGLVADQALTHGDLAERLHCDKTNITGLVDRLQRRQLIERWPDPNDRRASRVFLSEHGAQLILEYRAVLTTTLADRLMSCPPTHRTQLAVLARHAARALLSVAPADSPPAAGGDIRTWSGP